MGLRKTGQIRFWNEQFKRVKRGPGWSTTLLVLSSAALGGIAVALWNRKALASFQELQVEELPVNQNMPDQEDSFY